MRGHEREQRIVEYGGVGPVHRVAGVRDDDQASASPSAVRMLSRVIWLAASERAL